MNNITIDTISNNEYYLIFVDGKYFVSISKKNDLEQVKNYFGIN